MDVFFLRVSDYEACPDRFFAPLISGETRRAGLACGNPRVRLTKWLGEAMVRCLLRSIWGVKPSDYCILRGAHGKPYVSAAIPVFFNLSHSGDYVVCAVGGEEVGIDIERRGRVRMEFRRVLFRSRPPGTYSPRAADGAFLRPLVREGELPQIYRRRAGRHPLRLQGLFRRNRHHRKRTFPPAGSCTGMSDR